MSAAAVFWLGTACYVLGWMTCARVGRPAVEAKDRHIDRLASQIAASTPHDSERKDDGTRLLDDISDAWAHAERPGPRVGA